MLCFQQEGGEALDEHHIIAVNDNIQLEKAAINYINVLYVSGYVMK